MNVGVMKDYKLRDSRASHTQVLFFLKVLAPLEYKNLKRVVSLEERAHWQGKEAHGGLTYTTVI
jgi:hypothetical protein